MEPGVPEDQFDHVMEQLLKKQWGDLEVKEAEGRLLFPEKIYRRSRDGSFEAVPILIRILRHHEIRQARLNARVQAEEEGLDPDRDKDLIQNMEAMHELAIAMRDPKDPLIPFDPHAAELEKHYDPDSLLQIYEKLDRFTMALDPRPQEISEGEIVALAAAISKERTILPLAVYGPVAQNISIVYMADLLTTLQAAKSSQDSSEE
jgi:hypothetical protein